MIKEFCVVMVITVLVFSTLYFAFEAHLTPLVAECAAKGGQLVKGLNGTICVAVLK